MMTLLKKAKVLLHRVISDSLLTSCILDMMYHDASAADAILYRSHTHTACVVLPQVPPFETQGRIFYNTNYGLKPDFRI